MPKKKKNLREGFSLYLLSFKLYNARIASFVTEKKKKIKR